MPKRKGAPKSGGRQKGTPNKRTLSVLNSVGEILDQLNVNPIKILADVAVDEKASMDLRVRAAGELAQYLYPKRKAVDVKTQDDRPTKVEYGWVPRKSSEESSMNHSPASGSSTSATTGTKDSRVQ